jgi:alpha,alpha-trehalose phosphorylase
LYESHPIGYGERGFGFPEDGQKVVDVTDDRYPLLLHRPFFELHRKQVVKRTDPVHAIVAAEVGHVDLAYDYLTEAALMDLEDLEHNVLDGVHIASLGGALLAVMAGLGGLRDHGGELAFAPRLPAGLTRLAFPVILRGRCLQVEVTPRDASYSLRDGALQISHWGERIDVIAGTPATCPIPPAPRLPAPAQPAGRTPARRSPTPRASAFGDHAEQAPEAA